MHTQFNSPWNILIVLSSYRFYDSITNFKQNDAFSFKSPQKDFYIIWIIIKCTLEYKQWPDTCIVCMHTHINSQWNILIVLSRYYFLWFYNKFVIALSFKSPQKDLYIIWLIMKRTLEYKQWPDTCIVCTHIIINSQWSI